MKLRTLSVGLCALTVLSEHLWVNRFVRAINKEDRYVVNEHLRTKAISRLSCAMSLCFLLLAITHWLYVPAFASAPTNWREVVPFNFTGGLNGRNPYSGLVRDADGILFGTTSTGGSFGFRTVYEISQAGRVKVLHA
jgi:uncharacterized repeat protein (TIGR03803 family)